VEKPLKHNAMNFDIFVFEMTFDGTMNFELSLTCYLELFAQNGTEKN